MTVLLVAVLVVVVIVLIRYSDDSPTGSRDGSACCPHQVNQTNIVWIKYKLRFAISQYQYCVRSRFKIQEWFIAISTEIYMVYIPRLKPKWAYLS